MSIPKSIDLLSDLADNYDYWDEHPDFPSSDWRYEVANEDTREGYWFWVAAKISEGNEP